jgi:Flp pilus assembly protein CpaB
MLMTKPKSPKSSSPTRMGGPLSSRGGTLMVAALLSLVAGVALLIFLRQYRDDLTASDGVQVLVAKSLVPKGTTGEVVAETRRYRLARVKKSQLADGAITDPEALEGKAAKKDLFPGHQLTYDDFENADSSVGSTLSGFDRAMSVPVDKAHGMTGRIRAGDRVDVIVSQDAGAGLQSVATVAARNVLVLSVPDSDGSGVTGRKEQATIRVPDGATPTIAAAADGGEVWLILRPAVGARAQAAVVTPRTLERALNELSGGSR